MKKNLIFAGIGSAGTCISVDAMRPDEKILDSPLAGSWYEADPDRLRSQIQDWFRTAVPPENLTEDSIPSALIVPHAGYAYSGAVAASGYRILIGKKYDRVIIIGPSHRAELKNRLCIPAASGIRTPLGTVPLDRKALRSLAGHSFVLTNDQIHHDEHSVQIQLPFLQCALNDPFRIVPVIAGQLDPETVVRAARALSSLQTSSTLVVVSSDFTHFGRGFGYLPFRTNIADNLRKLDLGAFERIRTLDPAEFTRYLKDTGATICGEIPIRILMTMLPRGTETGLLKYATSADGNGDYSHCVSYLSGVAANGARRPSEDGGLPENDCRELLKIARESIDYAFKNHQIAPRGHFSARATQYSSREMGCFVTLKKDGELRGCIGEIEPFRPLYQAVADRAADSAFRDPRFPRLAPDEFRRVEIEISALTPARPVKSYLEIEIGRHGMTLTKDGHSAVFLPQVAVEQGWDLEETLSWLARKAGLAPDAWKEPGAEFTVFEAIVFRESDFRKPGK